MSRLAAVVAHEPVRVWLYGIGAAVLALLTYRGALDPTESGLWLAIAGSVVALPVATETLRARVSPAGRHVAGRDPDQ